MKHGQGKVVRGSSFSYEGLVEIGILPTETVIDMGDMELESVFLRKEEEDVEETQAVSAARNPDNKAFFLTPELMCDNGILDTLQKGPHERSDGGVISSQCAF
jgi:hypothetical protein